MTTPVKSFSSFLVNTSTNQNQTDPAITALADGRFLVTWVDATNFQINGMDFSTSIIRGQYMTATGVRSGTEFAVGTGVSAEQLDPNLTTVTTPTGSSVVVTWTENTPALGGLNVFCRMIGINGGPTTVPTLIGFSVDGNQSNSTVTALSDGRYLVAYTDRATTTSDQNIVLSLFSNNGALVRTSTINSVAAGDQSYPNITSLKNGGYVISWEDSSGTGGDLSGLSVRARIYNASGTALGAETVVNTTTSGQQYDSSVTALENGGFVVAFMDGATFSSNSYVRLQTFTATGVRVGTEVTVPNEGSNIQSAPVVTSLSDALWSHGLTGLQAHLPTWGRTSVRRSIRRRASRRVMTLWSMPKTALIRTVRR
jgi:hypothetical protein